MSQPETLFPPVAFVKARLFREAVYREDSEDWLTLRGHLDEIRRYFRDIGQELVFDEAEGYAFIRQLEFEGEERVPRLVQRRPLSYAATLLLVMLREEFLRFDAAPGDSTRLIKTRAELRNFIADFFPESTNQVRDTARIDGAIKSLTEFGFVRPLNAATEQDAFEVMRIVKARLSPADLETIKERLRRHAQPGN
jgi:hypothetical protein